MGMHRSDGTKPPRRSHAIKTVDFRRLTSCRVSRSERTPRALVSTQEIGKALVRDRYASLRVAVNVYAVAHLLNVHGFALRALVQNKIAELLPTIRSGFDCTHKAHFGSAVRARVYRLRISHSRPKPIMGLPERNHGFRNHAAPKKIPQPLVNQPQSERWETRGPSWDSSTS